jgi:2,3-bisphosphoglycerate-dependent phosphoglycerate mutase
MAPCGSNGPVPITRLILVRHGETQWNVPGRYQGQLDSPLTGTGLAQAGALAERLAAHSVTALYTSDLGRARQTAEIISLRIGCEVISHVGLRERHLGFFQGTTRQEARTRWPEDYRQLKSSNPDYAPAGGESHRTLTTRAMAALKDIAARHADKTIAVVTHGGPLSALLRHVLGIPLEAPRRFARANATWNVFTELDGKWLLETWGDTSHLPQDSESDT